MHARGANHIRQRGVRADKQPKVAPGTEALKPARDAEPIFGAEMAVDDSCACRQARRHAPGLRRARGIGEEPKAREISCCAKVRSGAAEIAGSQPMSLAQRRHMRALTPVTIELDTIRARIAEAARAAGRDPATVDLVAISKQQPDANVEAVLRAGHRHFGENRVQEAMARWSVFRPRFSDVRLRLVGPLQSNKASEAVAFFDAIDSLDRPKLAAAIADAAQRQGTCPEILIQVNTGKEAQKAGVAPLDADAFIAEARGVYGLPVKGLMCIPPVDEEPAMHFALLAKIAARNGLTELSMGMSGDFETAIRFGATMVRVGSALFGAR
jgi:PLP dependent protein